MLNADEIITDKELSWLEKYIENASPTGNERDGQHLWLEYIKPSIDEHFVDNYGNVAAIMNPGKDFKVHRSTC